MSSWEENDTDMNKKISKHACKRTKCSVTPVPMLSLFICRTMEHFVGRQRFPQLCNAR